MVDGHPGLVITSSASRNASGGFPPAGAGLRLPRGSARRRPARPLGRSANPSGRRASVPSPRAERRRSRHAATPLRARPSTVTRRPARAARAGRPGQRRPCAREAGFHRDRHRSFRVVSPMSAMRNARIQTGSPPSTPASRQLEVWWRGAIRKIRRPVSRNDATWRMTDSASTTKIPPRRAGAAPPSTGRPGSRWRRRGRATHVAHEDLGRVAVNTGSRRSPQ